MGLETSMCFESLVSFFFETPSMYMTYAKLIEWAWRMSYTCSEFQIMAEDGQISQQSTDRSCDYKQPEKDLATSALYLSDFRTNWSRIL